MRVVLDTSVWISALLWLGLPHRILQLAYEGRITIYMTLPLLQELSEVLARPKFAPLLLRRKTSVSEIILGVVALVKFCEPAALSGIIPEDPDDDMVIACAVAANAKWLVSGDEHILRLGEFQGIRIGSPRDFLMAEFSGKVVMSATKFLPTQGRWLKISKQAKA